MPVRREWRTLSRRTVDVSCAGSVRGPSPGRDRRRDQGRGAPPAGDRGTGGLSLRGVARAVGMTVQSLYHYFDSRDALLSALVTDVLHALADAAEAAAGMCGAGSRLGCAGSTARRVPGLGAGEQVGVAAPYGTPVPGFDPRPRVRVRERGAAARRAVRRGALRRVDARPARRDPAARGRCAARAVIPGRRAAARRARAVHRDARAHARAGDAGSSGGRSRTSASSGPRPRPWEGCPTASRAASPP